MKSFNGHSKVWLTDSEGNVVFGFGKYRLLREIHACGSISEAARRMPMSYRKAWGDIRNAEEGLGVTLLKRTRGGSAGGHAALTPQAEKVLGLYEEMDRQVRSDFDRHLKTFLEGIRGVI